MNLEAVESHTPALTEVDRKAIEAAKLRAEGRSWRACGEAVGMDPSNLRKALVARGYQESPENRRDQLAELFGQAAIEGAKQILERLEAGERITAKETAVIAAICADKVALAEAWARSANDDASDWLATIAARLKPDQTLELKVSAPPKAIDVTPSRQAAESAPALAQAAQSATSGTKSEPGDS